VAAVLAVAATAWRLRHPPIYEVTVGLRVTEGALGASEADSEELGTGALRAHVQQLAFSRPNMFALMARHPHTFPPQADRELALENLRGRIDVAITQNEFMEWHEHDDPPRSVQIAISYRDPVPEAAWTIANELGKLVIDTARARSQETRGRERAAADAALSQAGAHAEAAEAAGLSTTQNPKPGAGARLRMLEVAREATNADLLAAAAGDDQTLRFEITDQARIPKPYTPTGALVRGTVILAVLLLTGWLVGGAFDPRVLRAGDLSLNGLTVLGALPALPSIRPRDAAGATSNGGVSDD
jgi:uncharacterized protein involved in exopolysaccharide biosynthesis